MRIRIIYGAFVEIFPIAVLESNQVTNATKTRISSINECSPPDNSVLRVRIVLCSKPLTCLKSSRSQSYMQLRPLLRNNYDTHIGSIMASSTIISSLSLLRRSKRGCRVFLSFEAMNYTNKNFTF